MELGLARDVRELVLSAGGDFFGVADLASVPNAILQQGRESEVKFPHAIAIGVALPDSIVELLAQRTDSGIAQAYRRVYDETNKKLDQIAAHVVKRLQSAGAAALPVCASRTVDPDHLYGVFSHKMAAHLAGLGWIGKSCLLVTPEAGPRVRWATVLTDAALAATGQGAEQACGDCQRCVDMCPASAFSGRAFQAGEHRDVRFAARKCQSYRAGLEEKMGCPVLCGVCVSVCPHGKPQI